MKPARTLVLCLAVTGCGDPLLPGGPGDTELVSTTGDVPAPLGLPLLDAPCALDPAGTTLAVTTTDFATGSITLVDTPSRHLEMDVAFGSTDAVPLGDRGRLLVVHRFGHDFVDVLARGGTGVWASMGQHALEVEGLATSNPHSIAVADDGLAYVPLFAAARVRVLDPLAPPGDSTVRDIDLSAFADEDGNPEPSLAVACGDTVFVSVQRLDPTFGIEGPDALVAIDTATGAAIDVDPDRPGAQGIPLQGDWLRQLRRDPGDPGGHTLLGLTTGIERIDLARGQVTWAVAPEAFASVGADHYLLALSFDVDATGTTAYVALYGADDPGIDCSTDPSRCFDQARIYRVALDDPGAQPEEIAAGFDAVERTLEVIGDELWFGSRRPGAAGLWVLDLSASPPNRVAGPLFTGLPPYSLTVLEAP